MNAGKKKKKRGKKQGNIDFVEKYLRVDWLLENLIFSTSLF